MASVFRTYCYKQHAALQLEKRGSTARGASAKTHKCIWASAEKPESQKDSASQTRRQAFLSVGMVLGSAGAVSSTSLAAQPDMLAAYQCRAFGTEGGADNPAVTSSDLQCAKLLKDVPPQKLEAFTSPSSEFSILVPIGWYE
ncbi:hypothetical protein CYMTET_6276, partial [Cymbomonas tetramitiformis]